MAQLNGFAKIIIGKKDYDKDIYYNPMTNQYYGTFERTNEPINEPFLKMFLSAMYGDAFVNDIVAIVKGTKYVGERKRVSKILHWNNDYPKGQGYVEVRYLVFSDNTMVDCKNCQLAEKLPKPKLITID